MACLVLTNISSEKKQKLTVTRDFSFQFYCLLHGGLWVNKGAASHRGSSLHTSPQDDSLGHKIGGEISR
jgi:hypothetical protein